MILFKSNRIIVYKQIINERKIEIEKKAQLLRNVKLIYSKLIQLSGEKRSCAKSVHHLFSLKQVDCKTTKCTASSRINAASYTDTAKVD